MFSKVKIIYGSTTGNTQALVSYITGVLKESNVKVECIDSAEIYSTKFKLKDDIFYVFATSSWGVEPAALQEDFEIFWNNLEKSSIKNKNIALCGCGDNYYPHFCGALDLLNREILKHEGIISIALLKVQDNWEDRKTLIKEWSNKLVNVIKV